MKHLLFAALLIASLPLFATWHYSLGWDKPNTHTFRVALEVESADTATTFALPVWRPGRYIVQDYAAAVTDFQATDANGKKLRWTKRDAYTWTVFHAPGNIRIRYGFYGDNPDAGSSFLGEGQASVNGVNLFMYVCGKDGKSDPRLLETPCELRIEALPETWKTATALPSNGSRSQFKTASYHELVDCPLVMSDLIHTLSFRLDSTTIFIHFQGNYQGDADADSAAIKNISLICSTAAATFGGFPFREYHFIYRLLPNENRHAVEHSTSAMFILPERSFASAKALRGIYGITAHEFWHVWNVKRIRPAAMWPYDYSKPNFTQLQWFTEGVTDYYTSLLLVRAGISTTDEFSRQLATLLYNVDNTFAGVTVSPSEASMDSWLASSPYLYPHRNISYYTNGSKAGLLLDLAIRKETGGKKSLDDVFRYLYQTYFLQQQGVPEDGVQRAVEAVTGTSWQQYFADYIHAAGNPDYEALLEASGFTLRTAADGSSAMRSLGILRYDVLNQGGLLIRQLHPMGDAWRDGLGTNDLILEINGAPVRPGFDAEAWASGLKKGEKVRLRVAGDFREKEVTLVNNKTWMPTTFEIAPGKKGGKAAEARAAWIGSGVEQ